MYAFVRSEMLLGEEAVRKLSHAHVAVFGVGGVGSFAAEALARAGVGTLTLVDHDIVSESNLNRQLVALHSTIGKRKVDVMRARILDINPQAQVHALPIFYLPQQPTPFEWQAFDYIVDAIDTVSAKIALVLAAKEAGVPVISCMGAGNKLDPSRFVVADLFETSGCPLARVMRKELRSRGLQSLDVVYSQEPPRVPLPTREPAQGDAHERRATPGSVSFVPPVAGMLAAGVVIRGVAGV